MKVELRGIGAQLEWSPKNFVPLRPPAWLTQSADLICKQNF